MEAPINTETIKVELPTFTAYVFSKKDYQGHRQPECWSWVYTDENGLNFSEDEHRTAERAEENLRDTYEDLLDTRGLNDNSRV